MLNKKGSFRKERKVKMMYSHPTNIIIRTGNGLVYIDENHRVRRITKQEAQEKLRELRLEKVFSD